MMKCFSIFLAITFILLKARISPESLSESNDALLACIKLRQRAPFLKLKCEKLLDEPSPLNSLVLPDFSAVENKNDTLASTVKEVITLPQKDITNSTRKINKRDEEKLHQLLSTLKKD